MSPLYGQRSVIKDDQTNENAFVSHRNELRLARSIRLIGETQEGTSLDTKVWSQTLTGSGAITLANALSNLSTGTTANSSAFLASVRKARFITGTVNAFYAGIRLGDTGTANNVRRWGAYDASNGVFFQLNGTTIGIGVRQTAVDTIVTSFNGPNAFTLDTNFHTYEIDYTQDSAYFLQDSKLIHTYNTTTTALADTPHFKLGFENTNSGGGASNVNLYVRGSAILRYGEAETCPRYFHSASAATTVLKTGPGRLHRVILNGLGTGASNVSIYDDTSAVAANLVAVVNCVNQQATFEYGIDLDRGLTVVQSSASPDITVVYD